MKELLLKDIAGFCGASTVLEGSVKKISTDSRVVDGDTLFVALVGERFDANDFVEDVLSAGAKAVICSRYNGNDERVILVENTGKALLDIAKGYRKLFSIPFVAVTGSVGKTTGKGMIYSVLSEKYNTLRTEGNLNNEIGVPKTLFNVEGYHGAAVIEMGMNHFGEISSLSRTVLPDIGVITNVGTAHIENLGSREGILKAKTEILDGMKKGAPLIINGDNDMLATFEAEDYTIIRFGLDESNDMYACDIIPEAQGSRFTAVYKGERVSAYVPAVGIHNVYNALGAMCVGMVLGYDLETAAKGIEGFAPEGMRQNVRQVKGMTFIEDCYNANPDSMCASLETLKTLKTNRSIAVLSDMLELGEYSAEAHTLVGAKAYETDCDIVLTFGEAAKLVAQEVDKMGGNAQFFSSKAELTEYLSSLLQEGDTVLFKGSRGMKTEEIFLQLYKEWEV